MCLTGTLGVPQGYFGCASQVLWVCLTGTVNVPYRYCGCASQVLHTLTGPAGTLYRTFIQLFKSCLKLSFYKLCDYFCKPSNNKNLENKQNFDFFKFQIGELNFQFKVSFPYFEVSKVRGT